MFLDGTWNANLTGQRTVARVANDFDDFMHLCWRDESGQWEHHQWPITTDPGTYWLENPSNVDGTAMLVPGAYKYTLGLHPRNTGYEALVQAGEVSVYRDNDGDNILDPTKGPFSGWFGINIHKAGSHSTQVNKWSAGCQVFANDDDFYEFMGMVQKSMGLYGQRVTYALLGD